MAHLLVIVAPFYRDIADELCAGASEALRKAGATFDVLEVPGAFEIPGAIAIAQAGADKGRGKHYDGYVALGCVIRGETSHYDYVCGESARGLMELTVNRQLAIGYGILTVENGDQAWARARRSEKNKGADAVEAALRMIDLRKTAGL